MHGMLRGPAQTHPPRVKGFDDQITLYVGGGSDFLWDAIKVSFVLVPKDGDLSLSRRSNRPLLFRLLLSVTVLKFCNCLAGKLAVCLKI